MPGSLTGGRIGSNIMAGPGSLTGALGHNADSVWPGSPTGNRNSFNRLNRNVETGCCSANRSSCFPLPFDSDVLVLFICASVPCSVWGRGSRLIVLRRPDVFESPPSLARCWVVVYGPIRICRSFGGNCPRGSRPASGQSVRGDLPRPGQWVRAMPARDVLQPTSK